ncbi:hypothetical protein ACR9E3_22830 [Actinomycetospora sp. C-140]
MTEPQRRPFGELRLRGGRYEAPGFPVEVLSELSRYEQLIQDVARGLWKDRNPRRQRIPKGFSDRLSLRLTSIEDGSTIPVLERDVTEDLFGLGVGDIFEEAGSLIVQAVGALQNDDELPELLPTSAYSAFLQLGKSLRDDERIEVGWQGLETRTYSRESRHRLLERWSIDRFWADGTVVGRVIGVNAENRTFTFSTLRNEQLTGYYSDPSILEDLTDVIQTKVLAPAVRLDGELEWTATSGDPVAIANVRSLELFASDNEPWADRLLSLLAAEAGWLDGKGERIELAAIEAARSIMQLANVTDSTRPGIFPMADGGVQLEWQAQRRSISIEVRPTVTFECYFLDLDSKEDRELLTPDIRAAAAFVEASLGGS